MAKTKDVKTVAQVIQSAEPAKETTDASVLSGEAKKIWDEIKGLTLDLYGLPNQKVEQFAMPLPVNDAELCVVLKAPAALTAMEKAFAGKYIVEQNMKYVIIRRGIDPTQMQLPFVVQKIK
jgi:hypothetical protein